MMTDLSVPLNSSGLEILRLMCYTLSIVNGMGTYED
jgi:hypothetical protein